MNFSRNSSNFFKSKNIRSFFQNKSSFTFLNYNMNKFRTKNFIQLSNLYFLSSVQNMINSLKLGSSIQTSKLMIGDSNQCGQNLEDLTKRILIKLSEMNGMSETLLNTRSNE